jgi:hypothetical protein
MEMQPKILAKYFAKLPGIYGPLINFERDIFFVVLFEHQHQLFSITNLAAFALRRPSYLKCYKLPYLPKRNSLIQNPLLLC